MVAHMQPAGDVDGPFAVAVPGVVEGPVHGLQGPGLLVLGGGAVVEGDEDGQRPALAELRAEELSEHEGLQGPPELLLGPGAVAEEVREVAGVGGVEEVALEGGQGVAGGLQAEGVGQAEQVLALGIGEGGQDEASEVDEERGEMYDGLHGPPPATAGRYSCCRQDGPLRSADPQRHLFARVQNDVRTLRHVYAKVGPRRPSDLPLRGLAVRAGNAPRPDRRLALGNYTAPNSGNLFASFFEPSHEIAGVPFIGDDRVGFMRLPRPRHPPLWEDDLLLTGPFLRPPDTIVADRNAAVALIRSGADVDAASVVFDGCVNDGVVALANARDFLAHCVLSRR